MQVLLLCKGTGARPGLDSCSPSAPVQRPAGLGSRFALRAWPVAWPAAPQIVYQLSSGV